MSYNLSQSPSGPKDIDDGLLDIFKLPVRFVSSNEVEHTRRVSDPRKGIRNAIHVERWSEGEELGRGGFGTVNLQSEKSGLVRAVKKLPRTSGRAKTMDSLREVLAMAYFTKVTTGLNLSPDIEADILIGRSLFRQISWVVSE